jgi:hypothetical protein
VIERTRLMAPPVTSKVGLPPRARVAAQLILSEVT